MNRQSTSEFNVCAPRSQRMPLESGFNYEQEGLLAITGLEARRPGRQDLRFHEFPNLPAERRSTLKGRVAIHLVMRPQATKRARQNVC